MRTKRKKKRKKTKRTKKRKKGERTKKRKCTESVTHQRRNSSFFAIFFSPYFLCHS